EIRGTIRLDGKPASKTCNQLFTLEAKVRIFGVGPIVEKFIEAQARQTQERAAAFINSQLSAK
ncbi:MAG TPA: DUF2505 family protein, partial [Acidimicrobiales bacterium]|nr:DUF2505 family protein [Acidimicrobiales bacterium]